MASVGNEYLLVVEGQDDKHVIKQIRDRCLQNLEFDIKDCEGYPNILKQISVQTKVAGRKSVGFVMDSNSCPKQRWKDIREKLIDADFEPPENLDQSGIIINSDSGPTVGVWLMPNNSASGELEDFVIEMIKDDDPVWPLAQSYIDSIPEDDKKFLPTKSNKAKFYAWLATRKKPNRMGATIGAGDLTTQTQLNSSFMAWLSKLFG